MGLITLLSLFFLTILTSTLSGVIGMAGGIVLLSLMTFFLPFREMVALHGLVQLVSNSSRAYLLRKEISWKFFWFYTAGLPFGSLVAVYAIKKISSPLLPYTLICLLILYTVFRPKKLPGLKIPFWGLSLLGFGVGLLGPLIGATGPLIAPFFLESGLPPKRLVATKAAVQFIGHLMKIPTFLALAFPYKDYVLEILLWSAGALIGTRLGVFLLDKIDKNLFTKLFKGALLAACLRLLYKIASLVEGH